MFRTDLYVQVFEDRVRARNIASRRVVERRAAGGFSHPRALVGNFSEADATVKAVVADVRGAGLFRSVRILIQPMAKCEGGLTQIESRVLEELALGAGAAKAVVWVGEALSDDAVRIRLSRRSSF